MKSQKMWGQKVHQRTRRGLKNKKLNLKKVEPKSPSSCQKKVKKSKE
jgi:hypothetical protein